MGNLAAVDWDGFDYPPNQIVTCRCGFRWRTHAKFVASLRRVVARQPCPNHKCGKYDQIIRAESDPEEYVL